MRITETEVYIANIPDLLKPVGYEEAYASLPDFRKRKVDRFTSREDKARSVAAWLLLEKALKSHDITPGNITTNRFGKPYFTDCDDLFFNLSHSASKVMCVLSPMDVGCDIEVIIESRNTAGIAGRFFTEDEVNYMNSEPDSDKAFFRIWTMKESYLKALGTGIGGSLTSFSTIKKAVPGEDGKIRYLHEIPVAEHMAKNFCAACCSLTETVTVKTF